MTTNYERGRAKEYRIKKQLEAEGWPLVIRSAGSHGVVDVISISRCTCADGKPTGPIEVRLIQSKPKGGYLTPKERAAKAELEKRLGIVVEIV